MTTTPAVSICIPLYNKERFVAATIQSVLDQTFTDFELVVLDNASDDRSAELAESFRDPRIRLHRNESTVSGPENVTKVVSLSVAPLFKVVAADDLLHPEVLRRQVEVMRDPGIAVVSCRHDVVDEHGDVIYSGRSLRSPDVLGRQPRKTVLRRLVRHAGNPIGTYVNLLVRRSAYEASGGMPDAPWMAQDLAVVLAALRSGDFYGLGETLVDFRIVSGSESANDGREGIAQQVRYIEDVRRADRDLLRPSDLLRGRLRMPIMRARHQVIVAAAGPPGHLRTRAANQVLKLSRAA